MKLAIAFGALMVALLTVYSTTNHFISRRQSAKDWQRRDDFVNAIQSVASQVRWARDRYDRTIGVCNPPATIPRALPADAGGQGLCWPQRDGGCLNVDSKTVVCLSQTQSLASASPGNSLLRSWAALTVNSVFAQYFLNSVPPSSGSSDGSVQIRPMVCGHPDLTGCVDCAHATTDCFTVVFCVGSRGATGANCGANQRVAQTFVRRDR